MSLMRREIEDIKKRFEIEPLKMKYTISEMKGILDRINSSLDTVEEKISELENIAIETIQNETQKKRTEKLEFCGISSNGTYNLNPRKKE